MAKHPIGIRQWKGKLQAYVRTKDGLRSKSFPIDTPLSTVKAWRHAIQVTAPRTTRHTGPSLKRDVVAYLKRVRAMPTYGQRRQHLILWLHALGWQRPRTSITVSDIDRVLQQWLTDGLEPDTVRKRRTSLLALFTKLDGKSAVNPVRESTPPKAARPIMRGLDHQTLLKVLASLPPSKTAARLRVMAWTGLPPGMLMQITAHDVSLTRRELRVVPRKKGAGADAKILPLVPQAVEAFKELAAQNAFGTFAIAAAGRVLHRACKRSDVQPIRLYDLRHSFGALLYKMTRDLPTVQRFLLHASLTSTARYAMGAVKDVDRAAADLIGESGTDVVP